MNRFEHAVADRTGHGLRSLDTRTIQVNVGLLCNQTCAHCHLNASPARTEVMTWPTMEQVLRVVGAARCEQVDITGGAPELNPDLRRFIEALTRLNVTVQVRTNFTAMLEPEARGLPAFCCEHKVRLVGSLPCTREANVREQRGPGVFQKTIDVIGGLNALGYGHDPHLVLDLVYNPVGPELPPTQEALEAEYRRELAERFGIVFTRLLTIANMPIGRFLATLRDQGREEEYRRLLEEAFNPETIEGLMCRHQLSVGWDGTLYDCDFNLALDLPVEGTTASHVAHIDPCALAGRRVVTAEHCFGCTAGHGSSCSGELARGPIRRDADMAGQTDAQDVPGPSLAAKVEEMLRDSSWPTLRSLRVQVDGDVVTLAGCVGRYHEKQMALQMVQQIPGVREVIDQLEVCQL